MKCSQNSILRPEKSGSLLHRKSMLDLVYILILFILADSALAQISIEGVSDKRVYKDKVSFTVISQIDYDYTVELNGDPIETDVAVEVDEPEYYELYVYRLERSSGVEESELVRFIVRASERGNSEWGLPRWSPYPSIDSAAAECTGAQLKVIAPAEYPMGLEIPIVARIEDDSGNRLGINGSISAVGFEDYPLRLLRGVGSVFLPAAVEPNVISYDAEIQGLQIPRQITIEESTIWQTVSQDITTSTDWGENARVHISNVVENLLEIEQGVTLTIGAGSIIIIDPD
ncbi:MAG: hypothetical protein ACYSTT_21180, partial [Planctomycetota bacterium]